MDRGSELKSVFLAWIGNGAVLGVVTFTEIESVLKLVLLVLTIAYTALKIRKSLREGKK